MAELKDTMVKCTIITVSYFKLDKVYIDLQTIKDFEDGVLDKGYFKITNTKRVKLFKVQSIVEIYYDADAKDQVSAQELEARTRACIEAGEFTPYFFHTRRIKHVI